MNRLEWRVLILLVISVFVNYVDRGNLSIAAPLLEPEMNLNHAQTGALLGAFFWTYALMQLFGIAGWLAIGSMSLSCSRLDFSPGPFLPRLPDSPPHSRRCLLCGWCSGPASRSPIPVIP